MMNKITVQFIWKCKGWKHTQWKDQISTNIFFRSWHLTSTVCCYQLQIDHSIKKIFGFSLKDKKNNNQNFPHFRMYETELNRKTRIIEWYSYIVVNQFSIYEKCLHFTIKINALASLSICAHFTYFYSFWPMLYFCYKQTHTHTY